MYANFRTEKFLFWGLLLEEYVPIIKYIKGLDNDAPDALSRIQLIIFDLTESNIAKENLSERYCVNKLDEDTLPFTYQKIDTYQ